MRLLRPGFNPATSSFESIRVKYLHISQASRAWNTSRRSVGARVPIPAAVTNLSPLRCALYRVEEETSALFHVCHVSFSCNFNCSAKFANKCQTNCPTSLSFSSIPLLCNSIPRAIALISVPFLTAALFHHHNSTNYRCRTSELNELPLLRKPISSSYLCNISIFLRALTSALIYLATIFTPTHLLGHHYESGQVFDLALQRLYIFCELSL